MKSRILMLCAVFLLRIASACPAYTVMDSTNNDMKAASAKLYWSVIFSLNKYETGTSEASVFRTNWDQLSSVWMLFQTKLENWLRLLPEDLGRKDWENALKSFSDNIQTIRTQIAAGSLEISLATAAELKTELLLFYHCNPLDGAKYAAETGDKLLLAKVAANLSLLKDLPEPLLEFRKHLNSLYENFDDAHCREFLVWRESQRINLKKELSAYFEKHSWY
ncbi:MAG: hypothetical protein PHW04_01430 [Candidatus Wallbacteria bacterium]|nr:hypothetical protein [Candidatus Wallbacteria bacterium]